MNEIENQTIKYVKKRKKTNKFNIIDIILIILILIIVAALAYIVLGDNFLSGGGDVTVNYTIEIDLLPNEYIPAVEQLRRQKGRMTDSVTHSDLGEVIDVRVVDGYIETPDLETGELKRTIHPGHSRVSITLKANAKKDKVMYIIDGKNIMVGVQIYFRTPYLVSYGYVTYFEEINESAAGAAESATEGIK